jgi:glycosyltransferase involved in cell wall biosynthesis
MNIYKFSEDKDFDREYTYKVLVYPNITYMKDLEKDSYVVVLRNVIKELNKVRNDIHWTILSPYEVKSLVFQNTTQLPIELPSYPNAMRTHFNHKQLMKTIDWKKNDYDIVYSHLPEHTLQLSNMFANETNLNPKFIGYCHWYEVPENTAYSKKMLMHNIAGTLEMEECGVNTQWLKDLAIEKSKELFSDDVVQRLEKIIQPHYLGVDDISTGHKHKPKTILFNHRDNEYTGYNWFVKRMDELWEKRQDFKVYTTLTDLDRPYAERVKLSSRGDYLNFVRSMHMGVGCFQKYSAWSISTTDGLSQGVPYILPDGMCYPEMVGEKYPLLYKGVDGFKSTIEYMLDNPKARKEVNSYLSPKLEGFKWGNRIAKWFGGWKHFDELKVMSDTESYKRLVDHIHRKKSVSKKELLEYMGWGVRISFSEYRNRLRMEDTIKFTKNRYEVI